MESPSQRGRKSVHFEARADEHAASPSHADGSASSAAAASPRKVSETSGSARQNADASSASAMSTNHAVESPFQLTKDDVFTAFQFFDTAGTGVLQMANLKPRLSPFFPEMTMKEYRFLLEEASVGGSAEARPTSEDESSAQGLTAAQLWELIDSFQRLYLNPAMLAQRQATLSATMAADGSPSTSPRRGGGSPRHSPYRRGQKTAAKSSVTAAVTVSTNLRSANQAPPPSIVFDVLYGYDPVREAFEVYDPAHTGAVEVSVLGQIMARIGFGELSQDELALLVHTADFDHDGKISLSDFRRLVNMKERFKKKKKATIGR